MNTTRGGAAGLMQVDVKPTIRRRLKGAAVALLLTGVTFVSTGCYEDPAYYGHRGVRTGYYAGYAQPAPYYGYEPYPYGYGYGTGIGIGVSSYRGGRYYDRPRYYGRRYDRRRYDRRYNDRRYYDRRDGDRRGYDRRDGDRRRWDRGDSGERRRSGDRRDGRRSRSVDPGQAPAQQSYAPAGTQPE